MEATRNRGMEFSDGNGDKKGEGSERCSSRSDERPVEEILTGDDEEKKKKSVYVVMTEYSGLNLRLMRFDPHGATSSSGFEDVTPENQPNYFKTLSAYRVAALEPYLYFVGGFLPHRRCSNKVLVFNTRSREWDESIPPMRLRRAAPMVFICDKKIYVFGYEMLLMMDEMYITGQKNHIPPERWAEFYDPATNKWNYLNSVNKPPDDLLNDGCTASDFCEEQQCILFCAHGVRLYGYKVDKGLWFQVNENPETRWFDHVRGDAIARRKCLLFWHSNGTIFADRLPQDFPSSQVITLPNAPYSCLKLPAGEPSSPLNSFLINAGNGVLCLLYHCSVDTFPEEEWEQLALYIFELRPEDAPFLHNPHYHRIHPAEDYLAVDVFVM